MAGWLRQRSPTRRIGRHLLRDEGEVIVDEVRQALGGLRRPAVEGLVALALVRGRALHAASTSPGCRGWWRSAVGLHAGWKALDRAHGPLRDHEHAGVPGPRRARPADGDDAARSDPRHHRRQAAAADGSSATGTSSSSPLRRSRGCARSGTSAAPTERDLAIQRVVHAPASGAVACSTTPACATDRRVGANLAVRRSSRREPGGTAVESARTWLYGGRVGANLAYGGRVGANLAVRRESARTWLYGGRVGANRAAGPHGLGSRP